jgi:glycerol-3-phosphate dehydrogenase
MRLILRFFASARHYGADIRPYMEVIGLLVHDGVVSGADVHDHVTGKTGEIHTDLVVNAAGPWSERVAAMGGASVPMTPSPGVLLAVRGRFCNMVEGLKCARELAPGGGATGADQRSRRRPCSTRCAGSSCITTGR